MNFYLYNKKIKTRTTNLSFVSRQLCAFKYNYSHVPKVSMFMRTTKVPNFNFSLNFSEKFLAPPTAYYIFRNVSTNGKFHPIDGVFSIGSLS